LLSVNEFVSRSLELNLFFLRIMKEHSLFLQLGFTPRDSALASQAAAFNREFDRLLAQAVDLANGNVNVATLTSRQIVTQYTASAEQLTQFYTSVPINTALTQREASLAPSGGMLPAGIVEQVQMLDKSAYQLTSSLAQFKRKLLADVLACRVFTLNYPLLLDHILREAEFFMTMLAALLRGDDSVSTENLISQEAFWNRIMAEHSKFIAGLLDPTEEALIDKARMFGKEFDVLTAEAMEAQKKTTDLSKITAGSINETMKLRDFKEAGTNGILGCSIRSIIIPLLADHVLREANHYLCVLGVCNQTV